MAKFGAAAVLVLALALGSSWTAQAQSTCAETEFINEDMYGYYIPRSTAVLNASTISTCCSLCYSSGTCYAWTFDTRPGPIYGCYLRTQAVRATTPCTSCISGVDSRVASLRNLSTVSTSITTPLNVITLNTTIYTRQWQNGTSSASSTPPSGLRGASTTTGTGTSDLTGLGGSSSTGSGSGTGTGTSSTLGSASSTGPSLSGLGGGSGSSSGLGGSSATPPSLSSSVPSIG